MTTGNTDFPSCTCLTFSWRKEQKEKGQQEKIANLRCPWSAGPWSFKSLAVSSILARLHGLCCFSMDVSPSLCRSCSPSPLGWAQREKKLQVWCSGEPGHVSPLQPLWLKQTQTEKSPDIPISTSLPPHCSWGAVSPGHVQMCQSSTVAASVLSSLKQFLCHFPLC